MQTEAHASALTATSTRVHPDHNERSKDPDGPVLVFSRARWASFLAGLNG
ncbi:DUF397 domain-containing protein [Saccharopolyspora spinosa]|uniref:Uncharacterized protein DUF397 n=1 Tax=Saccharopolyspora spinosa TaxID=60894 RepID=A0A2N3XX09_SACSN|nr:DUF397 domain-containing protein [Saccharopolyspora spinosa]PKW15171.1 uncharacterized protein DUF397 [Saccharopolyspora spinosa]